MSGCKVQGKPHLTFSRGFWGVWWPELSEDNVDPVKEVALWIVVMNHSLAKPNLLCDNPIEEME